MDVELFLELFVFKNGFNLDNYLMYWEDNSIDDEIKSDFENILFKEMIIIGNEELLVFRSELNKIISNIVLFLFKGIFSLYGFRDSKV